MKKQGLLRGWIVATLLLGCVSSVGMANSPGTNHAREKLAKWGNHQYQPKRSVDADQRGKVEKPKKEKAPKAKAKKEKKKKDKGKKTSAQTSAKRVTKPTIPAKHTPGKVGSQWVVGISPDQISMHPVTLSKKEREILQWAQKYTGVPYHFGGTTPSGFDCSGYIRYVYDKAGIALPRSADEQYLVGKTIAPGNLRPGDLVFFETYDVGVSHSGIYIGQGRFISATTSRGVQVADMVNGYWAERYIGAKRVM